MLFPEVQELSGSPSGWPLSQHHLSFPENYFSDLQMFLLIIATESSLKIPFSDIARREKEKKKGIMVDKAWKGEILLKILQTLNTFQKVYLRVEK